MKVAKLLKNGKSQAVRLPKEFRRFDEHKVGDVGVSSITVAELSYCVQKSQHQIQNQEALLQFLTPLVIAEFDTDAAFRYGQI